jgi:hypothetical protein
LLQHMNAWILHRNSVQHINDFANSFRGELMESPCSLHSNYQSELSEKVWSPVCSMLSIP